MTRLDQLKGTRRRWRDHRARRRGLRLQNRLDTSSRSSAGGWSAAGIGGGCG